MEFLENLKSVILNIKFELLEFWNFEKLFKKLNLRIEFRKIKFKKIGILENWNFEKLFYKVNLRVEFRKIKFRKLKSWKNYFENGFWKLDLRIGVLEIK